MTKLSLVKNFLTYAAAGTMALSGAGCAAGASGAGPRQAFQEQAVPSFPEVGAENFGDAVFGSRKLVIVDFYDRSCAPCRRVQPLLADIAARHGKDIRVYTLDPDKEEKLAVTLNRDYALKIGNYPFMAAFREGKLVSTLSAPIEKEKLEQWVSDALEKSPPAAFRPLSLEPMTAKASDENFLTDVLGSKGRVLVSLCSDKVAACGDLQIGRIAARQAGNLRVINMDVEDSTGSIAFLQSLNGGGEIKVPYLYLLQDGVPQASFPPEKEWWRTALLLEKIIEKIDAGEGPKPGQPYKYAPREASLGAGRGSWAVAASPK